MKDGIGEGYTREDHQDVANQLFSCYAKVGDARALASVIGEDELSPLDKTYLKFGEAFEHEFVGQGEEENRTIDRNTGQAAGSSYGCCPEKNLTVSIPRSLINTTKCRRRQKLQKCKFEVSV